MNYDQVIARIAGAYPFGAVQLPELSSLTAVSAIPAGDARCRIEIAPDAQLLVGKDVQTLRRDSRVAVDGKASFLALGAGTSLDGTIIGIKGARCAVIIGPGCRLKGVRIAIKRPDCVVAIGAGTTWQSGTLMCGDRRMVVIGDDCMISNDVVIRISDGHGIFDAATKERINDNDDVFLGHHVWLGNSARVNKGARIGSGTVLGQCAIASGVLEGNCIYAGTPARRIRDGVVWSRTGAYEDIPDAYRPPPPREGRVAIGGAAAGHGIDRPLLRPDAGTGR